MAKGGFLGSFVAGRLSVGEPVYVSQPPCLHDLFLRVPPKLQDFLASARVKQS